MSVSCWDQLWVFCIRWWESRQGVLCLNWKPIQALSGPGVGILILVLGVQVWSL